jgi:glucose/arabinose dehydrogenase
MAGSVFLRKTETAVAEGNTTVEVEILRSGSTAGAVVIQYGIAGDGATPGLDFDAVGGFVTMAAGAASVTVAVAVLDDALDEASEVFTLSLIEADGAELLAPRTHRITILDDETPAPPPPVEPPLVSEHDVTRTTLVAGLEAPIRFTFLPGDPETMFVAERAGLIRAVDMLTGESSVLLDIRDRVNMVVDRGLSDIVFHPQFNDHPYLYAFYVVDPAETAVETGPAGADGIGNRFAHIVRYSVVEDDFGYAVVPGSEVVLVGAAGQGLADISGAGIANFTDPAQSGGLASDRLIRPGDREVGGFKQDYLKVDSLSHAGGRLLFGPDGMLYATTGDGTSYNYPDPRAPDVQSLDSLSGKVLRIDPLTGRGLADNPFAAEAASLDDNRAKIYQYGLRNPFSGGFDDEGRLVLADVGWFSYEELVMAGPGANFGWPFYEGGDGGVSAKTPQYIFHPQAAAFHAAVEAGSIVITPALRAFNHASDAPGFQMQAIILGAQVPTGPDYPASIAGHMLFSDFVGGNVFDIDLSDTASLGFLMDWPGANGPIHMGAAPDGTLYYVDLLGGTIGRLGIADAGASAPARLSVAAATPVKLEGNAGTTAFSFTITRGGAMDSAFSMPWSVDGAIAIGTMPADALDFPGSVLPSGTVSFAAGQASATVVVQVAGDTDLEGGERFDLLLGTAPAGVVVEGANAGAVIFDDDDDLAILSIAGPPSAFEGSGSGTTIFSFTVTRSVGTGFEASADWTAAGASVFGTLSAGAADFPGEVFPTGTVSFAAGQTSATIAVPVAMETLGEFNEAFSVTLSNASVGAVISQASANAVILNDDANLAIAPLSIIKAEGDAGTTAYSFTVTRAGRTFGTTVEWAVAADGENGADPSDFAPGTALSGTLSFAAGEASQTIVLNVAGDTAVERDERFSVTLSNPSGNTTITAAQAIGTIQGDDAAFGIVGTSWRQAEGTGGTTTFAYTVTRGGGSLGPQSVAWSVAGAAGPGTLPAAANDFAGGAFPSGTVSFAPGETSRLITFGVVGDAAVEPNERFAVTLAPPGPGGTLGLAQAPGLILTDDTSLAIGPASRHVAEGTGGTTTLAFTVTRAGVLGGAGTVDWAVEPGGMAGTMPVDGADFAGGVLPAGTVSFAAGQATAQITVALVADTRAETNESFAVMLSGASDGANIIRPVARVAVLDDDTIRGTAGNDALVGTPDPDLFVLGQGHDTIEAGAGRDQFRFMPAAADPANRFTFLDFSRAEGEILDLTRIDAIAGTPANDAFAFIGTAAFSAAGQLRWQDMGSYRLVEGDTTGNGLADLTLHILAPGPVGASWFGL